MYDPSPNSLNLQDAFRRAGSRYANLIHHPIDIPHDREPEYSVLTPRIEQLHQIYDLLSTHRDIVIIDGSERVGTARLASLGLDTVNDAGVATRLIDRSGHQARRRFSVNGEKGGLSFANYDFNIKTNEKTTNRKEWESRTDDLASGYDRFLMKNPSVPPVFVKDVSENSLYVSALCLAARGMTSMLHRIPEKNAIVLYDDCFDKTTFATPHVDFAIGGDNEFEVEGAQIFSSSLSPQDYAGQHDVLDLSLARIKDLIATIPGARQTTVSKLGRAHRAVGAFYQQDHGFKSWQEGIDHALQQHMRPEYFENLKSNLWLLGQKLPDANHLLPGQRLESYPQFEQHSSWQHIAKIQAVPRAA